MPTTLVVGGGSSAHVLIPFLSMAGHEIRLLTRRPEQWGSEIRLEKHDSHGTCEKTFSGKIARCSSDPAEVMAGVDIVCLCMPVHAYRDALHQIGPHLPKDGKDVFIGTIYGQAGFNWMVEEVGEKFNLGGNVVTFACGLIPWICRIIEYGAVGVVYGGKKGKNVAAVSPHDKFATLNDMFFEHISQKTLGYGQFVQAHDFLSLTLSVDNQIIHPARCYGLYEKDGAKWKSRDDIPYFYREFDERSADILRGLDDDFSLVRDAVRKKFPEQTFPYMLSYLELEDLAHNSGHTDIRKSFTESEPLGAIKPPTVENDAGELELDKNHRFFRDDIPYGLCIVKWIGNKLDIETPHLDEIIVWAQELRGEVYMRGGRLVEDSPSLQGFAGGIPPVYGFHSVEEIMDKN
jgi:opine dehydrogenase